MQVTKASAWRAGQLVQLPSGFVAKLRKPDVLSVIAPDGKVPDGLMGLIMGEEEQAEMEMTPEMLEAMLPMLNNVVRAAFMEPKVVEEPREDKEEIAVEDVDLNDKVFVLNWAMQGVAPAKQFPTQQVGGMDPVQNGKRVRAKAK